jgi:ribosomal-protein-alanine N-acetyltransferase
VATFPWAEFPTITTARLRLREIVQADADDVFRFRSDAEVQRYNTRPMRTVREAQALISTMQHWYQSGQASQWGITLLGEDRVVGICGLHDWLPTHRRAMLGYDLVREHWGR